MGEARRKKQGLLAIQDSVGEKGTMSVVLMHAVFHGDGRLTTWIHESPPGMMDISKSHVKHLYVVLASDKSSGYHEPFGGLVVLTSVDHNDIEFQPIIEGCLAICENIRVPNISAIALNPARIVLRGDPIPTEEEMVRLLATQYEKFTSRGRA